jgi:hypothetical protein
VVLKHSHTDKTYVIGHVTGVESCAKEYVIFIIYTSRAKKSILVWDAKNDKIATNIGFTTPCEYTPALKTWVEARKLDPDAADLFDHGSYWSRTEGDVSGWGGIPHPANCPELTAGLMDVGNSTSGSGWSLSEGVIHAYGGWMIPSQYGAAPYRHPCTITLYRGSEIFGFRFMKTFSFSSISSDGNSIMTGTCEWRIFDAFGVERAVIPTSENSIMPYFGNPSWTTDPAFHKDYFRSPILGVRDYFGGMKTKTTVFNIMMMCWTPVKLSYEYEYWSGGYPNQVVTPSSARVYYMTAQSKYFPDEYKDTSILPLGRNTVFENAIKDAIEMYYDLNGLAKNIVDAISWDQLMVK